MVFELGASHCTYDGLSADVTLGSAWQTSFPVCRQYGQAEASLV